MRHAAVTKNPASPASKKHVHRGIGGVDRAGAERTGLHRGSRDDPDPLEEREGERHDRGLADRRDAVVPARADEVTWPAAFQFAPLSKLYSQETVGVVDAVAAAVNCTAPSS